MDLLGLTRPYLQCGLRWPWHCVYVAKFDCVEHTLDEICDTCRSNLDYADSKPSALDPDYLYSLDQFSACFSATAVDACVDNLALNSNIVGELEDMV